MQMRFWLDVSFVRLFYKPHLKLARLLITPNHTSDRIQSYGRNKKSTNFDLLGHVCAKTTIIVDGVGVAGGLVGCWAPRHPFITDSRALVITGLTKGESGVQGTFNIADASSGLRPIVLHSHCHKHSQAVKNFIPQEPIIIVFLSGKLPSARGIMPRYSPSPFRAQIWTGCAREIFFYV